MLLRSLNFHHFDSKDWVSECAVGSRKVAGPKASSIFLWNAWFMSLSQHQLWIWLSKRGYKRKYVNFSTKWKVWTNFTYILSILGIMETLNFKGIQRLKWKWIRFFKFFFFHLARNLSHFMLWRPWQRKWMPLTTWQRNYWNTQEKFWWWIVI